MTCLNWWYIIYDSMFVITRGSKTWVINVRCEDLTNKEANYLNINCSKCGEHCDATQYINPAKKHLGLYGMLSQIFFLSQPTSSANTKEEGTNIQGLIDRRAWDIDGRPSYNFYVVNHGYANNISLFFSIGPTPFSNNIIIYYVKYNNQ